MRRDRAQYTVVPARLALPTSHAFFARKICVAGDAQEIFPLLFVDRAVDTIFLASNAELSAALADACASDGTPSIALYLQFLRARPHCSCSNDSTNNDVEYARYNRCRRGASAGRRYADHRRHRCRCAAHHCYTVDPAAGRVARVVRRVRPPQLSSAPATSAPSAPTTTYDARRPTSDPTACFSGSRRSCALQAKFPHHHARRRLRCHRTAIATICRRRRCL